MDQYQYDQIIKGFNEIISLQTSIKTDVNLMANMLRISIIIGFALFGVACIIIAIIARSFGVRLPF